MLYRTYRYSQWDGSQRIFEFDADQLMDLLSDDILNHCDVNAMLDDLIVLDLARQLDARLKNCLGLARDSFWNNRSTPTPPRCREHKRHTDLASMFQPPKGANQ